jgi:hypothetical protein
MVAARCCCWHGRVLVVGGAENTQGQKDMGQRVVQSYFLLVGHVAEDGEGQILTAAWASVDAAGDE